MRLWITLLLLGSCVPPGGDAGAPTSTRSSGPLPSVAGGVASALPSSGVPLANPTAPSAASAVAVAGDCAPPRAALEPLRHHKSKLALGAGRPHHSGLDAVALAGAAVELAGKLTYGAVRKDLEVETIVGWLRRGAACDGWIRAGAGLTDDDGRVALPLSAGTLTEPGRYPFALVVAADGSRADGELWLFAPGTEVVVFDIDGTLTAGDEELFAQLRSGVDPEPRPGAVEVARAHGDHGIQPIYLTGRPYLLAGMTRRWLSAHGFPPGPLLTPARIAQARPGDGVAHYKRDVLRAVSGEAKATIVRAYGNAASDLCAYAEAGVPPGRTFLLGPEGGKACSGHQPSQALASYVEHLAGLRFEE